MSSKIASIFTILLFLFSLGSVHSDDFKKVFPSETFLLNLPNNESQNWKEISRYISAKETMVESIPCDQTAENWSELIAFQFFRMRGEGKSIDDIIYNIRETILSAYPEGKVTWNIIEKNKNDIIYEWALHEQYNNVPPQHEIARGISTEKGLHRIGFTLKNKEMTPDIREKWVKLLRESALVVPLKVAMDTPEGLSIVDSLRKSIDLPESFQGWEVVMDLYEPNGTSFLCKIPYSKKESSYVDECIEIVSIPLYKQITINETFEVEKTCVQKHSENKVEFQILKQSPKEIIYTYSHPKEQLKFNAFVRSFLTDLGYFSFRYRRELPDEMQKEEILEWQAILENIQVR